MVRDGQPDPIHLQIHHAFLDYKHFQIAVATVHPANEHMIEGLACPECRHVGKDFGERSHRVHQNGILDGTVVMVWADVEVTADNDELVWWNGLKNSSDFSHLARDIVKKDGKRLALQNWKIDHMGTSKSKIENHHTHTVRQ